jgi:putative ABC transport system permease protein
LNKWAADDLAVTPGDSIEMEYYIDGPLGELQTQTSVLTLAGIVEMSGAALDKSLTPEYPGIQGAGNIADWDPPFPIDLDKIRPKDEDYWDDYGAAPKGFVSLETGQKLWQSRYGKLTSIRIGAAPGKSLAETEREIRAHIRATLSPTELGIRFLPVKSLGLEASSGATDFGALFGGLSFFLIISAAMLISLLFRLAIEQRSKEIGLLLAVGFTRKAINRLFLFQGAVLSFLGGVAGLALGAAYAALMIKGLQTWWIGAVSAVFLNLHVSGISLAIGLLSGVLISSVTIRLSLRALSRVAPSALLAGQSMPSGGPEKSRTGIKLRTASGALLLISGIGAICFGFASEDSPVGVFFTGGACLFISFLCFAAAALAREFSGAIRPGLALALTRLGIANAARNAGRSLLILTLVASASFLLVAVGANRHADTGPHSGPRPGTLGFSIVAESDIPLFYDLNSESGRRKLNLPTESTIDWSETRIYSLRLRPGEDVSCLNLYKPETPRIIGAPPPLIARGVGEFQSSLAETEAEQANPWRVLDKSFDDGAIPAIGDANTVMWILHSGLGKDIEIQDDRGETIRLRIAGLLSRSMLQSELVISEDNFTGLFPSQAGYRFFLAETSADATASTSEWMEKNLSDFGFDATSASERLSDYLAVEDTYISAFQSLGGLGLLLGVLGLSAVVMRNIFERRAELSLLWALGFKPRQIRWIIIAENAALLIAGLAIGTISALAALLPARRGDIASLPWASLSLTLGLILLAGIAASAIVAMLSMKSPSAASLRADT